MRKTVPLWNGWCPKESGVGDMVDGGVCFEYIQVCNSKEGSGEWWQYIEQNPNLVHKQTCTL